MKSSRNDRLKTVTRPNFRQINNQTNTFYTLAHWRKTVHVYEHVYTSVYELIKTSRVQGNNAFCSPFRLVYRHDNAIITSPG